MRIDAKGVKSYARLEISICRWKSPYAVGDLRNGVGDLRIPNALTVDLQSTRVKDPQLTSLWIWRSTGTKCFK